MTPAEIKKLVDRWLKTQLDADERVRLEGDYARITAHDEHVVEAIGGALWRKNTDDATIPTKPESELFGECRGGT
jgi:hypothetical protein